MNNTTTIYTRPIILKVGDRVRLVEPEVLISRSNDSDVSYEKLEDGAYCFNGSLDAISFNSAYVNQEMLNELSKWDTQEIAHIDSNGDIKFADIPWAWPKEVVLELVDENDNTMNIVDSSIVSYVRIYKDEVGEEAFSDYCLIPHAVLSKEDNGNSVYFYTISQNNIDPSKHLE